MGEVLVVGATHYPPLQRGPEAMLANLRWALAEPTLPERLKTSAGWPAAMAAEYGDDEGLSAAREHDRLLREGFARCRTALDQFNPDVVVIWGDDQYEQFREEVVPAFCVYGLGTDAEPGTGGHREFAVELTNSLVDAEFDVAYSYQWRADRPVPHAFGLTVDYLAPSGDFPYPVVPFSLNCYGSSVISRKGTRTHISDLGEVVRPDPTSPKPTRCMALGAAVAKFARGSDARVALVASSSWSHAFLHHSAWHLHPDLESDTALYAALRDGRFDAWRALTTDAIEHSGQQEILNWSCAVGAIEELGAAHRWSAYVPTWLCNSNKIFAIFS